MESRSIEGFSNNPELNLTLERITEIVVDPLLPKAVEFSDGKTPEAQYANKMFDGLMLTLHAIAADSLNIVKRNPKGSFLATEYEAVLRSIEPLAAACRALAEDKVPLKRADVIEEAFEAVGDDVSVYTASKFTVGNTSLDLMSVFIRQKEFSRVVPSDHDTQGGDLPELDIEEVADARLSITVLPKGNKEGIATIDIEQKMLPAGKKAFYRVTVGEENKIGPLIFPEETPFQEEHPFSSYLSSDELASKGVNFSGVLRAMDLKIAANVQTE